MAHLNPLKIYIDESLSRFKNIYGLYEKLQSKLYVSCGVGCWGPRMRLGSTNEIVLLSISNQA